MNKVSDILSFFLKELKGSYPENEIRSMFYISIEHILNYSKSDTIIRSNEELKEDLKLHLLR